MVGRPVDPDGRVRDASDGAVVGRVAENYTLPPELKPLGGGLRVDDEGRIYDEEGNVVGKMHEGRIKDRKDREDNGEEGGGDDESAKDRRTKHEQPPRPPSAPRPDELYLDVKSTFDGIQLVIKIPTVFNRDGTR